MLVSSARRPAAVALIAMFGLSVTGCGGEKTAAPEPAPTPIAGLNSTAMQVPRIAFCRLLPSAAVKAALDGAAESSSSYGNGDEESLPRGGAAGAATAAKDVVHEIGCSWTGRTGSSARAWIFAQPVSAAFARTVIEPGSSTEGCRAVPGPDFGRPSSTQVCRFAGGGQRVRHAGLFGQTWLSCELATVDGPTSGGAGSAAGLARLRTRTDAWCVEVANALNTAR